MTFDNNQLSTILLLVETSQLQEPELSEAWALLKHIQDQQMIETNYPVCDGCDCVAACSNVKDKACLRAVHETGWPAGMLQDDSRALSRHLSNNPNARQEARAAAEQLVQPPTAQPVQPTTGKNYDAGLWSRRNYEAMLEDQANSAQPVHPALTYAELWAKGEAWHDRESLGDDKCEHRTLEVAAYTAGYRAAIAQTHQSAAMPDLVEALRDMLSGWVYIRHSHGDLYGVDWDRSQEKAVKALAAVEPGGMS